MQERTLLLVATELLLAIILLLNVHCILEREYILRDRV